MSYPADLPLPKGYIVDFMNIIPPDVRRPGVWYHQLPPGAALDEMKRIDGHKLDLLYNNLPIQDVMMVQFPTIDHLGHHVQGKEDAMWWLEQAYDHCNDLMGDVWELVPAERVALVSDHGFDERGHTFRGIFTATGEGLAVANGEYTNLDVLPMLLELLGIKAEGLPGESELVWMADGQPELSLVTPQPGGQDEISIEDRAAIEQQLKALGYLE